MHQDGFFTYQPDPGFTGTDSFTYKANDGQLDSNIATVSITVNQVRTPTPLPDSYSVDEHNTLIFPDRKESGIRLDVGPPGSPDSKRIHPSDIVVLPNGTLRMYYVGQDDSIAIPDASGSTILSAVSSDGLNWTKEPGIRMVSSQNLAVSEPDVVQLDDGSYRMYYMDQANGCWCIVSALSSDGLTWVREAGKRIAPSPVGEFDSKNVGSPQVIKLSDGSLRMYYSGSNDGGTTAGHILSAVSDDGLNWTKEPGFRLAPRGTGKLETNILAPNIHNVADGSLRMYYTGAVQFPGFGVTRTFSAVSTDGLTWVNEPGVIIDLGQPDDFDTTTAGMGSLVEMPDGTVRFYYSGRANTDALGPILTPFRALSYVLGHTELDTSELFVPTPGVLDNDTNATSATLTTGAGNGDLSLNADGSFTYTPEPDFTGEDSFSYRAVANGQESDDTTVSITVNPVNNSPAADPNSYEVDPNGILEVAAPGLLADDYDIDGDPITAVLATGPTAGTLALNSDGSFIYEPDPDFKGIDEFTYLASDGVLMSDVVSVTLFVGPLGNRAPLAFDDEYEVDEDTELTVLAPGVLDNDFDSESNPLLARQGAPPLNGEVTLEADGSFTYTPGPDFSGLEGFTYAATESFPNGVSPVVRLDVGPPGSLDSASVSHPQIVTLSDGAFRMYYVGVGEGQNNILSAVSSDGLSWTREAGARFGKAESPDIIRLANGAYHMYFMEIVNGWNIVSASSVDGLNWTRDDGVRIAPGGPFDSDQVGDPEVIQLADGSLRMYYTGSNFGCCTSGDILSAVSSDGLTWTKESGIRVASNSNATSTSLGRLGAPVVQQLPDGTFRMFYYKSALDLVLTSKSAVSPDGLTWTEEPGERVQVRLIGDIDSVNVAASEVIELSGGSPAVLYYVARDSAGVRRILSADLIHQESNQATVRIVVNPVNDAPVAEDDFFDVPQNTTLNVLGDGVLANDLDVENNALTVQLIDDPVLLASGCSGI